MRAMWTGSLAFGLVNVPVKMYTATEDHSVRFHQVHAADGGRIRMKRVCTVCGEEVPFSGIAKGYETVDGQLVVLDSSDFDDLPTGPKKEVEILEFVPSDQLDPILFDRSYYLEPDGRALKPYVLLRQALESTDRTAVARVAIRQRTQLAALRVHDDVLVLQTMLWPDEIREPDFAFLSEEAEIRPQEMRMAQSLIANLSADFEPEGYSDEHREAILGLIESRLAGGEGVPAPRDGGAADSSGVVDLMSALKASVAETSQRGAMDGDPGAAPTGGDESAGKESGSQGATGEKPIAERPAARKTAPKKSGGKKTAKKAASAKAKTHKTA